MPTARYPWKPALILWAAGTLLSPLLLFYALGLYAAAPHGQALPAEGLVLVLLVLLRSAVMLAVAVGLGLPAARALGLGAPFVEAWAAGRKPAAPLASIVGPAVAWAAITAVLAIAIDAFFFHALGVTTPAPEIHSRLLGVAPWRGFLAAAGGGLFEELFYRLFLLSGLAWLLARLLRVREPLGGREPAGASAGSPGAASHPGRALTVFWVANLAVAIYFGIEHFGNEAMWEPLTPLVELRTVLIILPPGLAFGHLFRKHGLEAAALSHAVIIALVHGLRPWIERGWGG